jgi:hypothetical protein
MNDRLEIADGAIRFRDEQLDRLRAENAAQALLIASLKETEGAYYRLLELESSDVMLDTLNHIDTLTQQLSDTQRQNAELQAERDEARRAFDAVSKMQDLSHKQVKELIAERYDLMKRVGAPKEWSAMDTSFIVRHLREDTNYDANLVEEMLQFAIAASKFSNEKGDENE